MRRAVIIGALAALALSAQKPLPSPSGGTTGITSITQWGGQYTASSAGAQVTPYNHAVTLNTTGNFGTHFGNVNHWNDLTWVQFGDNYAIRQTGMISSISFSWANPATSNAFTALYFVICRPSVSNTTMNPWPSDCPVVAKSANLLSSLTAGAINTLQFCASGCASTPIYARKGDFYGFEEVGNFDVSTSGVTDDRFHYEAANCSSSAHCYIGTEVGTFSWNTAWSVNTSNTAIGTDNAVPVAVTMSAAPVFVAVGDSIILGTTRREGLNSNPGGGNFPSSPDPTSDMSYWISQATGWSYQNMGIGGQTTTQIAARFATDCVALKPQFCIIEGGVNDAAGTWNLGTAQTNWTSMLTAAKAAGITPVCLMILPWTNGNSTQNGNVDTFNAWLNGQCETYGGYTVDARRYVGQFRTGGATDNLWDIRPEFMATSDNLQIHYSTLGYQAIARAILDRLGITTSQPIARKNGVYYAKTQSKTASIASTTASCTTDLPWAAATCEHGLYRLSVYMSPQTAAATSTVTLTFNFTDPGTPGNSNHAYSITTSSLDLSAATNNLQASYVVALDGITQPTWSTTYTGTASYQVYVALERID